MKKKNRLVSESEALLLIALALLLTGRLSAGEDDAKAEKAVKALGGKIVRDANAEGKPIIKVDLSGKGVTDTGLKELAGLKTLRMLNLNATKVTDLGLKELAALKNLRILDVGGTEVTDTGLKELTGLKNLQVLNLNVTKVSD
jgi:internalin A